MSSFDTIFSTLKAFLSLPERRQLSVRSYIGINGPFNIEDVRASIGAQGVTFDEEKSGLRPVVLDVVRLSDGKILKHESNQATAGAELFNRVIADYCLDFAKYVVVLRNRMK